MLMRCQLKWLLNNDRYTFSFPLPVFSSVRSVIQKVVSVSPFSLSNQVSRSVEIILNLSNVQKRPINLTVTEILFHENACQEFFAQLFSKSSDASNFASYISKFSSHCSCVTRVGICLAGLTLWKVSIIALHHRPYLFHSLVCPWTGISSVPHFTTRQTTTARGSTAPTPG